MNKLNDRQTACVLNALGLQMVAIENNNTVDGHTNIGKLAANEDYIFIQDLYCKIKKDFKNLGDEENIFGFDFCQSTYWNHNFGAK